MLRTSPVPRGALRLPSKNQSHRLRRCRRAFGVSPNRYRRISVSLWFEASLVVFIEDALIGAVNSAFFVAGFLSDLGLGFMVTLLFSVFFLLRMLWAGTALIELDVQNDTQIACPLKTGTAGAQEQAGIGLTAEMLLNTAVCRPLHPAQFELPGWMKSLGGSIPDRGESPPIRKGAAKLAVNPAGEEPASRTCPVATEVIPDGGESDLSSRCSGVKAPACKAQAASGPSGGASKSAGCSERSEPLAAKRRPHR